MKQQLSLRFCLIFSLALIVIAAFLSTEIPSQVLTHGTQTEQTNSDSIATMLESSSTHWGDTTWQKNLSQKIATLNMTVVIQNAAKKTIYQSGSYDAHSPIAQQIIIVDNGHQLGTALIYNCIPTVQQTQQWMLIGLISLLLILAIIVSFIVWAILRPLAALSLAAHHISHNDLHFHLPSTHIQEVTEVFRSFTIMRNELKASLERQITVEQERKLFISAIAHDLRTPLFSLRGYLEGLKTGLASTPEKVEKYIDVCQKKADTLEHLISDLFTYTQLEYLELVPQYAEVEISALILHILESLELQARNKNIRLKADRLARPYSVNVDDHLLTRVLENLLDNALRYTPAGGWIDIHWYPDKEHFIIEITDTGPGIADEDLPYLFNPLYRGDSSRNQHTGGAGLGLTIARRILQAHGGDLTVKNGREGGAIFTGSFLMHKAILAPTMQPREFVSTIS